MTFRRRQLLGWGVLLGTALLGGAWLARLDFAAKISTDVLDLIPADERAPELTLVRSLASQAEARTMFFELTAAGQPAPADTAARFAAELGRDPAFDQVVVMNDPAVRESLGHELFEQRFALLFPLWLEERAAAHAAIPDASDFSAWLAQDAAAALGRFLSSPEALAFQELVPADPL